MHSRKSSSRPSSIFLGQERVGDRGARGPDQVGDPAPDLQHHRVGRGETAHGHDRPCGRGFDPSHVRLQHRLPCETRHSHFQRVIGNVDVPQVGEFGQQPEHPAPYAMFRHAVLADGIFGLEPHRDAATSPTADFRRPQRSDRGVQDRGERAAGPARLRRSQGAPAACSKGGCPTSALQDDTRV